MLSRQGLQFRLYHREGPCEHTRTQVEQGDSGAEAHQTWKQDLTSKFIVNKCLALEKLFISVYKQTNKQTKKKKPQPVLEKTLILGGIGGRRRRGQQRMRWLDGITDSMDMSFNSGSWWWTGRPGVLWFMGSQRVRHDWATELNWTCSDPYLTLWRE